MSVDLFGDGSFLSGGCIDIPALRQGEKLPTSIGSRTIYSAEVDGDGNIVCDLENEEHVWVYGVTIDGTSFDKQVIWKAGGSWPIMPPDHLLIDSFEEPNKTMGSPGGGLQRGDSASIAIMGFTDWRFAVLQAIAFGGSEATSWGDFIITPSTFEVAGYFKASDANTILSGTDTLPDGTVVQHRGNIAKPLTGNMVAQGSTVYTRIDGLIRPATLSVNTYWVDEQANRIYFSPANDGATVTIRYNIDDRGSVGVTTYTETYLIDTSPVMITTINYSDWIGADEVEVLYSDGTSVLGYSATDVSGKLALELSGDDAGKRVTARTKKAGTADDPGDGVTLGYYPGYSLIGKKRDRVLLVDETGLLASRIGELPGTQLTFWYSDCVFYPPATPQWTEYNTDDWQSVGTAGIEYVSEHGRGKIHVAESWFAGKPENICFRVVDLKLFDHRDFVNAEILNKTRDAIDKLDWIKTSFGGGLGSFSLTGTRHWSYDVVIAEDGPCAGNVEAILDSFTTYDDPLPAWEVQGWLSRVSGGEGETGSYASINYTANILGVPEAFKDLADDVEILEATAEVSCSATYWQKELHQTFTAALGPPDCTNNYDNTQVESTTPIALGYVFFAILRGPSNYEVIGTVPGTPDGRTEVIDVTSIIQAIWARKRDGNTIGFGITPGDAFTAIGEGVWAFLDGLRAPRAVGSFMPACATCAEWYATYSLERQLLCSNPTLSNLRIRVGTPPATPEDAVQPRYPVMN